MDERAAEAGCGRRASFLTRRSFLAGAGGGLGAAALASLLGAGTAGGAGLGGGGRRALDGLHFPARAKRVIWLFMHGGPSHIDLWEPKPELHRLAGQPLPESFGGVMTRRNVAKNPLKPPIAGFRRCGKSGLEVSDLLPRMGEVADELCVIRSCHGDSVNHPQSVYQMNTGSALAGKPSVGAWISYGLGSENSDMPAFVVMPDPGGGIKGGPPAWGAGFLPGSHQGTPMRAGPSPILNLSPAEDADPARRSALIDFIRKGNRTHAASRGGDDDLDARIRSYELAFRMQSEAPELVDLSGESEATRKLYGIDEPRTREFGTRCLLARRMIERGVRFVQIYCGDTVGWDAHEDVESNHGRYCAASDRPAAGLIRDLRARGLLDDTLVIWGGEFGRMPMSEQGKGRDHNPWGYSTVLAGAGVKGGFAYGATDSIGLRAEVNPVHIHDLHATILHLLGIDHEKLTFFHNGRNERLTDVAGNPVAEILT